MKTLLIRGVSYGTEVEAEGMLTRLSIPESPSTINGIPAATVMDYRKGVNINSFNCNCLNMPNREKEYQEILEDEECKLFFISMCH